MDESRKEIAAFGSWEQVRPRRTVPLVVSLYITSFNVFKVGGEVRVTAEQVLKLQEPNHPDIPPQELIRTRQREDASFFQVTMAQLPPISAPA